MADIKARYTGPSGTGVDLFVELDNGEIRNVHIPQGGELPTEVGDTKVSAGFRDSLLEQDGWIVVRRETKHDAKPDAGDKEGDA